MRQLKEDDVVMTYEANGIPPITEWLVSEYYMEPGSITAYRNGILRQYLFKSVITRLNQKGIELYKDDKAIRKAATNFRERRTELEHLCTDLMEAHSIEPKDIEQLIEISGKCFKDYEHFDAWYTDGAYPHRDQPGTAAALEYAEKEKNVLREEFSALFFDTSKNFLGVLRRLAVQLGIEPDDISWYFGPELARAFEGTFLSKDELQARQRSYVYLLDTDGTSTMLVGDEADTYIEAFEAKQDVSAALELRGQCASKGPVVRGVVRIINSDYIDFSTTQRKMDAMNEGDVLVSPTTAPDLMPALRKAAAIVTDTGGMLSHAALTARELGKPCVVGTKIASRVLKDGDMVEVDAEKGTVRKI
ncbi:MAG: atp-grasp fold subdomain 1 [Candidatus Kaiserbacteria bacterium]|nr:atp-grasp fold subdomain 1 [Candidatus Kaiserbacteria bacterium]